MAFVGVVQISQLDFYGLIKSLKYDYLFTAKPLAAKVFQWVFAEAP